MAAVLISAIAALLVWAWGLERRRRRELAKSESALAMTQCLYCGTAYGLKAAFAAFHVPAREKRATPERTFEEPVIGDFWTVEVDCATCNRRANYQPECRMLLRLDVPESTIRASQYLADELERLMAMSLATPEEVDRWYEVSDRVRQTLEQRFPTFEAGGGELEHFFADADIRAKDTSYRDYQHGVMMHWVANLRACKDRSRGEISTG